MNRREFTARLTGAAAAMASPRAWGRERSQTIMQRLRTGHPRLHRDAGGFTRLRASIQQDALLRQWYAHLQRQAEAMLREPTAEYRLIGPRLLSQSRAALRRISTLAGLYRLDGDARKAARARQEMLAVCAFPNWHPPHFLDVAEMTNAVALGYDWLHDELPPQERATIRGALVQYGLKAGLQAYRDKAWWTTPRANNWGQVCNGGLVTGALAVGDEAPEAAALIPPCLEAVRYPMRMFAPDGGWIEGPGYWSYATEYTTYLISALDSALGGDFGLSQTQGFAETGMFRAHSIGPLGWTFNYADAHEGSGTSPQMLWMARRFRQPLYAQVEHELVAAHGPQIFHLVWASPEESQARAEEPPLDAVFRAVQVAFFRSRWQDRNAAYAGFKGGSNAASHAHLDLGNFVFDLNGQRWALDLGPDDYNLPGYFGKQRWDYYRLRSEGHNTLTLGSRNQNLKAEAPLLAFASSPERAFAVADLSQAYQPEVTRVHRGLALLQRRHLLIQDEVEMPSGGNGDEPLRWNFHTRAEIELHGAQAQLSQGGQRLVARILEPANARFEVISAMPPRPQEQQPDVHNLVIRLPRRAGMTRIAVLLSPAGEEWRPKLKDLRGWIAEGRLER